MSRLIVKNLPAYLSDTRLREHFSSQPSSSNAGYTITDARLARKPDGTSRKFGFVGYKTPDEAARAKAYFHRSFIDSSRITVEVVVDHDLPSRKRPRPAVNDENRDVTPVEPPRKKAKKDAQLEQFMETMKPRAKNGRTWADDVLPAPQKDASRTGPAASPKAHDGSQPALDEDVQGDAANEEMSDLEWMKRRMRMKDDEEKVYEQSDDDDGADVDKPPEPDAVTPAPQVDQTRDTILSTGRLFLRNLAYSCTADELQTAFSPFGNIAQIHIPLSPAKTPTGVAFVTFAKPADALAAHVALDGTTFQGRLLHILAAVDRRPKQASQDGKASLKDKKLEERKTASGKGVDWGMLYMNSDAVAASVAAKLGVDKAEILNGEDGNAAVKLALAETQLVQETKAYLEEHGVNLDAFSTRTRRSPTTILVKNLPAFTTPAQIQELFSPFGELRRVLVPPSGTIAVVEFANESEAGVAWRAVSYRRFGNSIIYLEKGPVGMWKSDATAAAAAAPAANLPTPVVELPAEKEPEEAEPGSTLFIKNLSFTTTSDTLSSLTRTLPGFVYARVQTKPSPKDPSGKTRLSMGYGFVGFKSKEEAERGRKALDGVLCEGHKLSVRFAGRGREDEEKQEAQLGMGRKMTTKMVVKNVPFEATKSDIRQLFSGYGQLKSVRLPTKFDRRTRGFAFLEFITRREAEAAMAALKHTHLLGRHLVLEWADEEGGMKEMERLREKTKKAYGDGAALPGKKKKVEIGAGEAGEDSD